MRHDYLKTGYLKDDVRVFHIKDRPGQTFEAHYHDFHKLMILLEGDLSYTIEGHRYEPVPGDLLFVPAGEIHQPEIRSTCDYDRIIFYISDHFADTWDGLELPFDRVRKSRAHLLRMQKPESGILHHICEELLFSFEAEAADEKSIARKRLYQKMKLVELLLLIDRIFTEEETEPLLTATGNPNIQKTLAYIHEHLQEESLSIEEICDEVFLNRSYLMHLFKEQTGYSIGQYICEKRLFLTASLVKDGMPVTDACLQSGFKNYAAYYHAIKKKRGGKIIL